MNTNSCSVGITLSLFDFSNWLATERQKRDWSQRELARRAGVSHSQIAMVESGRSGVSAEFCIGIANAFGSSIVDTLRYAGLIGNSIADAPQTDPIKLRIDQIVDELNEADKAYALHFLHFLKTKPDVRPSPRASPDILGKVRRTPKQKETTPITS